MPPEAILEARANARGTARPAPDSPVRAVVRERYCDAADVEVRLRTRPECAGGALVRVRAAALTKADWHLLTGRPYLIRAAGFGLTRPKSPVLGQYFAGTVVELDESEGSDLRVGDEVFGDSPGAFTEVLRADAKRLVRRPSNASPEVAAVLPHGALTALQALRDAGRVRPGQRVLVIGAAGAVGVPALQLARQMGAEVTAVVRDSQREWIANCGAHRVLTTPRDDFAAERGAYDLILDTVRDRRDRDYRRALRRGGRAIMISGGAGEWFGGMLSVLRAAVVSNFTSRKLVPFMTRFDREDLAQLADLAAAGQLRPLIGSTLPLEQAGAAFDRLTSHRARGVQVLVP